MSWYTGILGGICGRVLKTHTYLKDFEILEKETIFIRKIKVGDLLLYQK